MLSPEKVDWNQPWKSCKPENTNCATIRILCATLVHVSIVGVALAALVLTIITSKECSFVSLFCLSIWQIGWWCAARMNDHTHKIGFHISVSVCAFALLAWSTFAIVKTPCTNRAVNSFGIFYIVYGYVVTLLATLVLACANK